MALSLSQKFDQYIEEHNLFHASSKLLVACSAGIDSMVLCHLLLKKDIPFELAHVNYKLRGDASDADQFFVQKYGRTYFIPVHVKQVDSSPDENTQQWARKIRYKFFDELIYKNNLDAVLTAHHFDDQIETLILNFTRGSGLSGIKGIASSRGNVRRPLLFARKQEIVAYAKENGLAWRDDASNAEDHYRRNVIRHHITPTLDELRMNDSGMRRTFSQIKQLDRWLQNHFSTILSTFQTSDIEWQIPLESYRREFRSFELFQLVKQLNFNMDHAEKILTATRNSSQFFSDSHVAIIDRGMLVIRKKMEVHLEDRSIDDFEEDIQITVGNRMISLSKIAGNLVERSDMKAYFDGAHVNWPIKIRKWRHGDRFQPYGMYGKTKKVSDLLTHLKLSFFEKEETLVLVDSKDVILYVIGCRRSIHNLVTDKTSSCVLIEVNDIKPT